ADVRVAGRRSWSGVAESRRQARQAVARDGRQEEAGHAACPAGPGRVSERRTDTPALLLSLPDCAAGWPPVERVLRAEVDRLRPRESHGAHRAAVPRRAAHRSDEEE